MNIDIDGKLVAKAMKEFGVKDEQELVEMALREMLAKKARNRKNKRKGLFELAGKIEFYDGYDYKKLRNDRDFSD